MVAAGPKIAVLLINTGSPRSLRILDVACYLRQFLSDQRIIDIAGWRRHLLVNLVIVPSRVWQSRRAYRQIWQDGSPLLDHSRRFASGLSERLPDDKYLVAIAMRYGRPSIAETLTELLAQEIDRLLIVPMFPQYSSAANGSAIAESLRQLADKLVIPQLTVVNDFYRQPFFIDALAESIRPYVKKIDHLLFSYHGLPERQLPCKRSDNCCAQATADNRACYRFHCLQTTGAVAKKLNLVNSFYSTSFQSRLGRMPWIKPYTDSVVPKLAEQGCRKIAVVCPSFVADCLETIEEIAIRLRDDFIAHDGQQLTLIPCLNSNKDWLDGFADYVQQFFSNTSFALQR